MAKMTKKGRTFVSDEISHLMKEGPSKGPQKNKKMPQKQAVAVALDVSRRKGFKTAPNPKEEAMSIFDSIVKQESGASLFDDIVESSVPTKSAFDDIVGSSASTKSAFDDIVESKGAKPSNWDDRVARTLTLSEELTALRGSVKKNS